MANTIRIKRRASGNAGAPTSLENAELAYNEVDDILYYGKGTGGAGGSATTTPAIAGSGAFTTLTSAQTISGNKTFTGTVDLSAATIAALTTTGNVTVGGNLTVSGTTTTVNSSTVTVDDKNLELGSVSTPTDTTADGGGITLKGATDKTINWVNSTNSWTFSEHIDLASNMAFKIAGTSVLNATTLGSGVTASSLTSVGTISSGTWNGTAIAVSAGGTGSTTASAARAALGLEIGADVQAYNADLAAISGLSSAADRLAYYTGSGAAALATFTSFGRSLVDDADAAAGRSTLGIGTMGTQAANSVAITGGTIDGVTIDAGTF